MSKGRAALYFSRWELQLAKAAEALWEARLSHANAEREVVEAKLLARTVELARLRKLLRKHKIRTTEVES